MQELSRTSVRDLVQIDKRITDTYVKSIDCKPYSYLIVE